MRVPQYPTSGGVRPATQPTAAVAPFAPVEAFGGGTAQGVGRVAEAVGEGAKVVAALAIQQQREINENRARDALNRARGGLREHLIATFQKKGKDAESTLTDTQTYLNDLKAEISEGLENPRQRDIFGAVFDSHAVEALDRVATYRAGELERWRRESLSGSIQLTIEGAAVDPTNKETMGALKAELLADVVALTKGDSPPAILAQARHALTQFHQKAATTLAATSYKAALEYIKEHRSEMEADVYAKLAATWEEAAPIQTGERAGEEAIWEADWSVTGASKLLEGKDLSPAEREHARRRVLELVRQREAAFQVMDDQSLRTLAQVLDGMPDEASLKDTLAAVDRLEFSPETRQRLREHFKAAKAKQADEGIKAFWDRNYNGLFVKATENPAILTRIDMAEVLSLVGTDHWSKLIGMRDRYKDELGDQVDQVGRQALALAKTLYPDFSKSDGASAAEILEHDVKLAEIVQAARNTAQRQIAEQGNKLLTAEQMAHIARLPLTDYEISVPGIISSNISYNYTESGNIRVLEAEGRYGPPRPLASAWAAMKTYGITEDGWDYRPALRAFESRSQAEAEAFLLKRFGKKTFTVRLEDHSTAEVPVSSIDVDLFGNVYAITDARTHRVSVVLGKR